MTMRSMLHAKKCGSLMSMRHITTRPYEDKSVPHLTLYVQQMTKTKLLKEREVMHNRLGEIDKQLRQIDECILALRPKLGLPEPTPRKRKHCKDEELEKKNGRKKKFSKMKMSF